MIEKTRVYAPDFIARWERPARAFQLRYLARQAIRLHDGKMAIRLAHRALTTDLRILVREPGRTLVTLSAAYLLRLAPQSVYRVIEGAVSRLIGGLQGWRISRELARSV